MAVENLITIRCDRCGIEQSVKSEFGDMASAIDSAIAAGSYDWQRVSGTKPLCGDCAEAYKKLQGKQEAERRRFFKVDPSSLLHSGEW